MNIKSFAVIATAMLFALFFAASAQGEAIPGTMTCFEGTATLNIKIDDAGADPGELLVTVEVGNMQAKDIRAVYLDLALDDVYLSGLSAHGDHVTSFDYGDVINLGPQTNLHRGGSPCPCDFGVEIGTPGKGKDVVSTTTFVLAHESLQLDLGMFFEQSVGARISGAGSKCSGVLPLCTIPEDPICPVP